MIHLQHATALGPSSYHTQLDIRHFEPKDIEHKIKGIFALRPEQIVTLRYINQPLLTLSVQKLSNFQDTGLVYLATSHSTAQGKRLIECFYPRTDHSVAGEAAYLPSLTRCVVALQICRYEFYLPHLGEIERLSNKSEMGPAAQVLLSDEGHSMYRCGERFLGATCAFLGIGAHKKASEDAIVVKRLHDSSQLMAVVDGVGGRGAGLLAARAIVSSLAAKASDSRSFRSLMETLQADLAAVHTEVSERYPMLTSPSMGATMAVVNIGKRFFQAIRAGDCRIGQFRAASRTHTCIWLTTDERTEGNKPRNIIHLENGNPGPTKLEVLHREIQKGDTIILGSDGFWNTLPSSDILQYLSSHEDVSHMTRILSDAIRDSMQQTKSLKDNFSFILYRHGG